MNNKDSQLNKKSMSEMFKGYIAYSNEEYKRIWENSIIVIDTNILLNLYRYSDKVRETIISILNKTQNRLWIPYQVGKEFFKNRENAIIETLQEYDQLTKEILKNLNKAKEEVNRRKDNRLKAKERINKILEKDIIQIENLIKKEREEKKNIATEDKIEKIIIRIFDHNMGAQFEPEEFSKIKDEGLRRIKNNIPPGYKDKAKEENGDYYIFYSMMQKAKKESKDIIFVTDDEKEDWFNKYNGEKHGGRKELLNEFYQNTGRLLLMYTTDGFVQAYNKNIDKISINDEIIQELKNYRRYLNNNIKHSNVLTLKRILKNYNKYLNYNHFDKEYFIKDINKYNYGKESFKALAKILIESLKNNEEYKEMFIKNLYTTYMKCKFELENENNTLNSEKIYIDIIRNINDHITFIDEILNEPNKDLINKLYALKEIISNQIKTGQYAKQEIILRLNNIIN